MFWNLILGVVIILLLASGLFDLITWQINVWLIVVVAVIWFISLYNSLIKLRLRVKEALSDIDIQTKRRYDLIPSLVETVKGYIAHEKGVLEGVTRARTQAMSAQGLKDKEQAENMLSNTLKTLFAVSENYPDLKANANFLYLQRELADTENKIMSARRFHNNTAQEYNSA